MAPPAREGFLRARPVAFTALTGSHGRGERDLPAGRAEGNIEGNATQEDVMRISSGDDRIRDVFAIRLLILLVASVGYLYLSGLWATAVSNMHASAQYLNFLRLLLPAVGSTAAAGLGERWSTSRSAAILFWVFTASWVGVLVYPFLGLGLPAIRMAAIPGMVSLLGWFAGSSPVAGDRLVGTRVLVIVLTAVIATGLHLVLVGDWQSHISAGAGGAFIRLLGGSAALLAAGGILETIAGGGAMPGGKWTAAMALGVWLIPLAVTGYELFTLEMSGGIVEMGGWPGSWRAFYSPVMLSIFSAPMGALATRALRHRH